MTEEQLKRGNKIKERLNRLAEQKKAIGKLKETRTVRFSIKDYGDVHIDGNLFDIELCQTLLLARVTKEINELETEFENL